MISLSSLSGIGFFLLLWESLALVCFSADRSSRTTSTLVAFGSSVLVSGSLIFVWPGEEEERKAQKKLPVPSQPVKRGPGNLFYNLTFSVVNTFFGSITLLVAAVYLSSSVSLHLQSIRFGESSVAFPVLGDEGPQYVLVNETSIVRVKNKNQLSVCFYLCLFIYIVLQCKTKFG